MSLQYNFVGKRGDFVDNYNITALTVDPSGTIYAAGTGLSLYYPATNTQSFIGDLPSDMQAGGDLMFYQGELYLTTVNNTLVKIDIDNPQNSMVYMEFPPSTPLIDGLAVYPYDCVNTEVYAISRDANGSNIYRLDMENQTLTLVCETPYHLWGASTDIEWQDPVCFRLDLDTDDSSGLTGLDVRTDTFCRAPIPLAEDPQILIDGPIDSIIVRLSGIVDAAAEYLEAQPVTGIDILGNNSPILRLRNTGGVGADAFENLLRQIRYQNLAADLTYGQRIAELVLYSGGEAAVPARSYIELWPFQPDYQVEYIDVSCFGNADGSVQLISNDELQLNWLDGSKATARDELSPGSYLFTLENELGCRLTDSVLISEPEPLTVNLLAERDTVCQNDGQLTAVTTGGTPEYAYQWSNGEMVPNLSNLPAGAYSLTLTDANGCAVSGSYTLEMGTTIRMEEHYSLCPEETFILDGQSINFASDTLICRTYTTTTGCDSTHCYQLSRIQAELQLSETISIDLGDSVRLDPVLNFQPQSVHWTPYTGLSCPDCLSVTVQPQQNTIYQLEVTTPEGCTLQREVQVNVRVVDKLYIPNAFSPNGDGVNDTFEIFTGSPGYQIRSLRIFNRWGQLVYQYITTDTSHVPAWDGTDQQGRSLERGVYIYRLEIEKPMGRQEILVGDLNVL